MSDVRAHLRGLKLLCNANASGWNDRLMDYCDFLMAEESYAGTPLTASEERWKNRVVVVNQYDNGYAVGASYCNKATGYGILACYAGPYTVIPSWWESYYQSIPIIP